MEYSLLKPRHYAERRILLRTGKEGQVEQLWSEKPSGGDPSTSQSPENEALEEPTPSQPREAREIITVVPSHKVWNSLFCSSGYLLECTICLVYFFVYLFLFLIISLVNTSPTRKIKEMKRNGTQFNYFLKFWHKGKDLIILVSF